MDSRKWGQSELGYWVRKEVTTRLQVSLWGLDLIFWILLVKSWEVPIKEDYANWFLLLSGIPAVGLFFGALAFRKFIKSLELEVRD
jgi:hypothetical protein